MNTNPKVYVGTYGKYNSGSIAGAWIDLVKCGTYEGFLAQCRETHKDEHDPEYMIQDCECMPDGLAPGEWLSQEDFNDILEALKEENEETPKFQVIDYSEKAIALVGDTRPIKAELKALGGRFNPRLSCGAGWVFPKSKLDEVQALIGGGQLVEQDSSSEDYKAIFNEYVALTNSKRDAKYYVGAVRLGGGYYLLEKPHIETRFCWADEGEAYEHYKHVMSDKKNLEAHFIAENLSGLNRSINALKDGDKTIYRNTPNEKEKTVYFYQPYWGLEPDRASDIPLSGEEREILINALTWSREVFKKRLNAYLKRYGTSKLHTWTYWRDA